MKGVLPEYNLSAWLQSFLPSIYNIYIMLELNLGYFSPDLYLFRKIAKETMNFDKFLYLCHELKILWLTYMNFQFIENSLRRFDIVFEASSPMT